MVSQVFQQGRLFCYWNRHYVAPPHCSLSSPHLLRRKKPENVSRMATICSLPAISQTNRQIGCWYPICKKCPFSRQKVLVLIHANVRINRRETQRIPKHPT